MAVALNHAAPFLTPAPLLGGALRAPAKRASAVLQAEGPATIVMFIAVLADVFAPALDEKYQHDGKAGSSDYPDQRNVVNNSSPFSAFNFKCRFIVDTYQSRPAA